MREESFEKKKREITRWHTHLMIKRKTPQKHISTASTEKMLDSSATDTNIAVIVVSRPPPRRPPQHRGGLRRPHTCTHTRTRWHEATPRAPCPPLLLSLAAQLSTVNPFALSRPTLFSRHLTSAVVDTSASTPALATPVRKSLTMTTATTTMTTTTLVSTYAIGAANGTLPAVRRRVVFSDIFAKIGTKEGMYNNLYAIETRRNGKIDAIRTISGLDKTDFASTRRPALIRGQFRVVRYPCRRESALASPPYYESNKNCITIKTCGHIYIYINKHYMHVSYLFFKYIFIFLLLISY